MTQSEINAWVEKKKSDEDATAEIASIRQQAEIDKKELADQIAAIDNKKDADIQMIKATLSTLNEVKIP